MVYDEDSIKRKNQSKKRVILFSEYSPGFSMHTDNQTKELFLYEEMKRGKEYAFDFFFNYYYPGLCAYAQKMISIPEQEARDLVQDVFVKFWNDREKSDIRFSIRSYLFASVKNRCFDLLRKKDARVKTEELSSFRDVGDESFETYVLTELEDLFNKSLDKLPEGCREVFEMSRLHGLKNREIATKLDISEKTVEKQITNALHILRIELKDYLPLLILFDLFHFLR
jgi:RNA polymerase sigma-70 factor (ECF subfamily)